MFEISRFAFEGDRILANQFVNNLPQGSFYTYFLLTPRRAILGSTIGTTQKLIACRPIYP